MQSFIKWAGGKSQLVDRIKERMPKFYNTYYEPFIGSGALLFDLLPQDAVINDINKELIHVYVTLRDNPNELINILNYIDLNHCEPYSEYYYKKREEYNLKIINHNFDIEMAALFIYLNKHCFNGLYRVNRKGLFNVPFNGKTSGNSFNEANLFEVSKYLQTVNIKCGDFEVAVKNAKKGDFVFFDSPYVPLKDTSFESYTKTGFDLIEHKRLAKLFKELTSKGVLCMLTNHNTQLINELYSDYKIEIVAVKRLINSDSKNRVGEEVIITNY